MRRRAAALALLCALLASLASPLAAAAEPKAVDHDYAAVLKGTAWSVTGREEIASGDTSADDRTWTFRGAKLECAAPGKPAESVPCNIYVESIQLGAPWDKEYLIESYDGKAMVVSDEKERLHLERKEGDAAPAPGPEPEPAFGKAAGGVELAAGTYAQVKGDAVNLRDSASTKGKVVRKLKSGERLDILEVGPAETVGKWGLCNWFRVRVYDKKKTAGWLFGAFAEVAEGCSQ